ncbi:MAG: ATP-dependent helicase [Flavobacteriales bacterium]|nr:ATP-dependent helicase [Flavobacteriales bacterium]
MPQNGPQNALNPQQQEAVLHLHGPAIVVAGAGTGKTRILEYRVLNLVISGVPPQKILLLTFTREAAAEMLSRAAAQDPRCREVEGGTFHAFALKKLREEAELRRWKYPFTILDEEDSLEFLKLCLDDFHDMAIKKWLPRPEEIQRIFSKSINQMKNVGSVILEEFKDMNSKDLSEKIKALTVFYHIFREKKLSLGYLEYDDILERFHNLLNLEEGYRKKISESYAYIMVDEYQDSNPLQESILKNMAAEHKNILVVGDDAQSIYGFRGASARNLKNFYRDLFPDVFVKMVVLKNNYRSTQPILDLANAITDTMSDVIPRRLVADASQNAPGAQRPQLLALASAAEEAETLADIIQLLQDVAHLKLSDQAVLFRSAYISIPLQTELLRRGIPYAIWGGKKFTDLPHVKDFLAFFRVLMKSEDILSWRRILNTCPPLQNKEKKVWLQHAQHGAGFEELLGNLWPKLIPSPTPHSSETQAQERLRMLNGLLQELYQHRDNPKILTQMILDYYTPILKERQSKWEEPLLDIQTVAALASGASNLEKLLEIFSLEPPRKGQIPDMNNSKKPSAPLVEDYIVLSTIHSAKGREWNTVYVMGLQDGMLPDRRSLEDREALAEEHRLLYVAVTRARFRLYLSFHTGAENSSKALTRISRFLKYPEVLNCVESDVAIHYPAQ